METARTRAASHEVWEKLFSLRKRPADDQVALLQYFRDWCVGAGVEAAAFYAEQEGTMRRLISHGDAEFPESLDREKAPAASTQHVPLPDGLLVVRGTNSLDGSDPGLLLVAAAARIVALKAHVQEQRFQARFRGVELESLYEVGLAITSTLDLDALSEEVLLRAVSLLDARRGALYLIEDGHYCLRSQTGGGAERLLPVDDPRIADLLAADPEVDDTSLMSGVAHVLAVPIELEDQARGLLVVGDKESRRGVGPFPPHDRRTLLLFANQAAIALENAKLHRLALEKERLEREMELASTIQKQILPKAMPTIEGYEVLGWNRPARQVGGDYFDCRQVEGGLWDLVVGDVTGKGMPAALMVSTLHSALRLLPENLSSSTEIVEKLNRHIYEASNRNKFITLLRVALDPAQGELTYLNAGHNPGLLIRADDRVEELSSGGLPLGLMPAATYEARTLTLGPGDLVCLYSDGITECENLAEEEYGLDRLIDLLRSQHGVPLAETMAQIDDAVTAFAQNLPQGDDQTVVLLRRLPTASAD